MAENIGFEPMDQFPGLSLSKGMLSTSQPILLSGAEDRTRTYEARRREVYSLL